MSGAGGFGQRHAPPLPPVPPALLEAPRRRGSRAFTVVLTVALLIGSAVMALVLLASDAPGALVIGVLLAVLPVGPVIAAFLWLDRYEPEPVRLLALAFAWGAVVATAGALVLQAADQFVLGTPESLSAAIVALGSSLSRVGPGAESDTEGECSSSLPSRIIRSAPWETRLPIPTINFLIVPAAGDGTSIVALSDSIDSSGMSISTRSPTATLISTTGTFL